MPSLLAVVLAGGTGERLSILAQSRAKPAVPFAGKYRIIDFTLSNCVNSGIHQIIVLTQYQPVSLTQHIGIGQPWGLAPPHRTIRLLQPYLAREERRDWYQGTADAVFQNLDRIEEEGAETVVVLSGDHVYKMDFAPMLESHWKTGADVTLAVTRMPADELHRFGTVVTDDTRLVTRFQEKVQDPDSNLVSMGVYVFNTATLRHLLEANPGHDFGRHVFPHMTGGKIYAYPFDGYWRDIGTIDSYWQANMEVLAMTHSFLAETEWPIYTREVYGPPTKIGDNSTATNCLLSGGCRIEGHVEHSIISPGVQVAEGAVIRDSILMNDTIIGPKCVIDHAIIDKEVIVGAESRIGYGDDYSVNHTHPKILNSGLTIIGKRSTIPARYSIGRNCIVYDNASPGDFPGTAVQSGETIKPKRRQRKSSKL
jgi:glucose-1-phosphate adenylyltransferase